MYQLNFYRDSRYLDEIGEFILTKDMLTQCNVNPLYAVISHLKCNSIYGDDYYGSKKDVVKFRDAVKGCDDLNIVIDQILSLQLETYYVIISYK